MMLMMNTVSSMNATTETLKTDETKKDENPKYALVWGWVVSPIGRPIFAFVGLSYDGGHCAYFTQAIFGFYCFIVDLNDDCGPTYDLSADHFYNERALGESEPITVTITKRIQKMPKIVIPYPWD